MPLKRKKMTRRPRTPRFVIKRFCRFCKEKTDKVDYKNADLLGRYTTEQGKILPRRISGNCAYHQRQMTKAIKRARAISLLPYAGE